MLIPWSCVTALRLEPIGPIRAEVFGLRWTGNAEGWHATDHADPQSWEPDVARYEVCESRRLAQLRDALGQFVHDPRVNQAPFNPERHPFYTLLCEVHRALQEEI